MKREHHLLPSDAMGRRMHVWCYGDFGHPVLVFPTAAGFAHEWEAQGMIDAVAGLIEAGRIKLYCTESNVAETWTNKESDPQWRVGRHRAYERYVLDDLVPAIRSDCRTPDIPIATTGCSLGALYAATFCLKQPETFPWALCMSGRYRATEFTGEGVGREVYFDNPMAFVPNLSGAELERVRRHAHLVLVCGQGPWEEGCIEETCEFADILAAKGISHERDIWGRDVSHGWEWWRRQAAYHLERKFGR